MHTSPPSAVRLAVVLRPRPEDCEVAAGDGAEVVGYGAPFRPRAAELQPGHLVAVHEGLVLWRWFDAVVLSQGPDGVRLWEPAHGEVLAQPRDAAVRLAPGTRAWASAGLAGADWWVEGPATEVSADVDAVVAFYDAHGMWARLEGA